ncbi:MAG TPA: DUF2911 domain-containing protein [Chryseosolibacter sp.]
MRTVVPAFFLLLLSSVCLAQENFKARPSPLAIASMRHKDAYVKIVYSQPQKRDREIFGKLVPFGQVWRLGANEATEITITKDMLINATLVKAGTYSLFAIPNSDKWTFIINSDLGIWGAYNYNSKLDVLRFDVPVKSTAAAVEAFTMAFDQKNELANLLITWDKTKIEIPFKFIN